MEKIILRNTLPNIFKDDIGIISGIWLKDLTFERGRNYLVQANSGTGKSSLCSYIYGYRADYSGNIFFDQKNIRDFKLSKWDDIRRSQLSLLFQELHLFSELTAFENVQLKNNLTNYKTNAQIDNMFERLGIMHKKEVRINKMSWGQQQRVAIIRNLCQPFSFILLDEPISHLDDTNAAIVAELIQSEASSQGAGIIATSIGKHLPLEYFKTQAL